MSLPELPTMPGVTWVPFDPGHVAVMDIKAQNYQAISKALDIGKMLEIQARSGHAITAILHGKPVACFGSVKIWTGVEEMWCFME